MLCLLTRCRATSRIVARYPRFDQAYNQLGWSRAFTDSCSLPRCSFLFPSQFIVQGLDEGRGVKYASSATAVQTGYNEGKAALGTSNIGSI